MNRFVATLLVAVLVLPSSSFTQTSRKPKAPSTKSAQKKPTPKKSNSSQLARSRARAQARAAEAARIRRMNQAFVESADLKPMANQLLQTRSRSAFSGVEKYAKRHAGTEAGSLAWLVTGYARSLESDHQKAISSFKNAKPNSRELGDYVDYFLASAYRSTNSPKDVILVLDGFEKRYPDSLFLRDAALMRANALVATGATDVAVDLLESHRSPARADIELALGRAYAGMGQSEKAVAAFRNVYYEMPLSGEADEAGSRLRQLISDGVYGSRELRKKRADLLSKSKRFWQAASEYRQLIIESEDNSVPGIQVALANALYRSNSASEARSNLAAITDAQDEVEAQRLYLLAEIAREDKDDAAQTLYVDSLRTAAPQSGWFQEALMSQGNKYLLRNDFANAASNYAELARRFPAGKFGSIAHWKAAWLTYRMGQFDSAKQQFDEQIALFPASSEAPNALYWRGRVAEQQGELQKARSCYQKLSERFRNYYYAMLARERLKIIKLAPVEDDPAFAKIPPAGDPQKLLESSEGVTDLRLQKARLLSNAAMYDQAIKELEPAAKDADNRWAVGEIARLYQETGRPHTALQTLKRAIPAYFAVETSAIPRSFLETLFPRPYWKDLKIHASANSLDPYLVASLIRQESEFNPGAVSHANAYGLMQLLPDVGKKVAKQVKLKSFSTSRLLEPEANLRLGTRYFRQMIDQNGGTVEYALAAYNAGSNRVSDWRASGDYKDMAEFVESIPFTETREYVQAIVRNMEVYKRVYAGQ